MRTAAMGGSIIGYKAPRRVPTTYPLHILVAVSRQTQGTAPRKSWCPEGAVKQMLAGRAHRPRSRRCARHGLTLRRACYIIAHDPQIHLCVLLSASSAGDDFVKFRPSPACRCERASARALAKISSDLSPNSVPS